MGRNAVGYRRHLAAELVVREALVGEAVTVGVDHHATAEAEGERASTVGLLEPGTQPALVHVLDLRTESPTSLDELAGVRAGRSHGPLGSTGYAVLGAQCVVALETAGRHDDAALAADHLAARGRNPDDPTVLDDVVRHVLVGQHGAAITYEGHQGAGYQRLTATEGVATALSGAVTLDRGSYESSDLWG